MNKRTNLIKVFEEENQKINLSSFKDPEEIYYKHILDSIELNKIFSIPTSFQIADIWTWWGFPLLPLAITNPQANFIWIEGRKKKTEAIQRMQKKLWLKNVSTIWERAEKIHKKYDIITLRAVSYADKIFEITKNLLKPWSKMVLYKKRTQEEDNLIKKLSHKNNFKLEKEHIYKTNQKDIEKKIYILNLL